MEKHDIPKLERHIKELSQNLTGLADNTEFDELLKIIHRPGYTTPAEFLFAIGVVESMTAQTRAMTDLKRTLVNACRKVGESKSAGA